MRHKSKLRLVHDKGNAPEPISTLSTDEQAQLLDLADVALQNKTIDDKPIAGNRARQEHERLKQELTETVERFEKKRDGNQNDAA
jgi:hypothetical protein